MNIKGLFFHNFALKTLSLSLAIVVYLLLRYQKVYEYPRVARLRIVSGPNHVVVGPDERTVDVTVRGPSAFFAQPPSERDLIGSLDISREKIGRIRVRLTRENFPLLDKNYGLTIHDSIIETELDTKITRTVAVRGLLQGEPQHPLGVHRILVEPSTVEVTGSKRELQKIENISTLPINISGIKTTQIMTVQLALEDFLSVRAKPDRVQVQVLLGSPGLTSTGSNDSRPKALP